MSQVVKAVFFSTGSFGSLASGWRWWSMTGCQWKTGNCCLYTRQRGLSSGAHCWKRPTLSKNGGQTALQSRGSVGSPIWFNFCKIWFQSMRKSWKCNTKITAQVSRPVVWMFLDIGPYEQSLKTSEPLTGLLNYIRPQLLQWAAVVLVVNLPWEPQMSVKWGIVELMRASIKAGFPCREQSGNNQCCKVLKTHTRVKI